MDKSKAFSTRSLLVIVFWMGILTLLLNAGLFFGFDWLVLLLSTGVDTVLHIPKLNVDIPLKTVTDLINFIELLSDGFYFWIVPFLGVVFLILAIIIWITLKLSVSGLFKDIKTRTVNLDDKKEEKDIFEPRIEQERKRRLFLHFFSVLQKEGRLLDFFAEDLELYDDEQIGAAVRSIHDDCKKTMNKYIAPLPVIDKEEGEMVEVEPGFDPNAVKLTGNVAGDPPFKGVLRHRGWKAGKKDIPQLSDTLDAAIIAPAEIEME